MVDSGARAAQPEAPQEQSSPTSVPSEEEGVPAAKASPPATAPSGGLVVEILSAKQNPNAKDTPGLFEADAALAQGNVFPCDADPELITIEEEHYRSGPASVNFFCRVSLPPAPDRRQRQPTDMLPQEEDQEINVGHADSFKGRQLYVSNNEGGLIIQRTPPAMRQKVREAHMTGPVRPQIDAIRNQRDNTLRYIAEFAEDPIFARLGNLNHDDGTFDQAREFLRAELYPNDVPDGFTPRSFKCLIPLVVGVDDHNNPAALGCVEFWRPQSCRVDEFAQHTDLVQAEDGFSYQSHALAAHGMAALQPETVEVLGVLPADSDDISGTSVYSMWQNYKAWPSQTRERSAVAIP
eukprot:2202244-Pyramimonas_sp.AAC.1